MTAAKPVNLATWEGFQTELQNREVEIKAQLPPNIDPKRFIGAAIAAVKQNPLILTATPRSLFSAVTKAAQDGLLPDGREGVINVYNVKVSTNPDRWEKQAQWLQMIYGIRKRARELGEIIIDCQIVYDGDVFRQVQGDSPSIVHEPAALGANRGNAIGAYAIFRHGDEVLHREVMSADEIELVRSKSKNPDGLLWSTFWTEGWKKTVARRGVKSVPSSPKLDQVFSRIDEDYEFPAIAVTPAPRLPPSAPPAPQLPPAGSKPTSKPQAGTDSDGAGGEAPGLPPGTPSNSPPTAQGPASGSNPTPEPGEASHASPTDDSGAVSTPSQPATPETTPGPPETSDLGRWLDDLDRGLADAETEDDLDKRWYEADAQIELADDPDGLQRAFAIYQAHQARVRRKAASDNGQGDLLGGDGG